MRGLALLPVVFLVASCATLSEGECRGGDWAGIGREDGEAGRGATFIDEHAKACADLGIAPDRAAWEAGRQAGLQIYCTPRSAWEEGARGVILRPVCDNAAELRDDNRRGLRFHRIGREISRLEARIGGIDADLARRPAGDPARAGLSSERAALRLEIMRLRTDRMLARY